MGLWKRAMRCFLGVNKYATLAGVEGDMAWCSPNNRRHLEMLRLWNRIVSMSEDRLPKVIYKYLREHNMAWVKDVEKVFSIINCLDVFERNVPIVNIHAFLDYAKGCLLSKQKVAWLNALQTKPKLHMYLPYKSEYET